MHPLDGDALPPGARVRLGTSRFRPGSGSLAPVFSPDGERVLVDVSEAPPKLRVLEARSGQLLETLRPLSEELARIVAVSWTERGIRAACQLYGGRPALLDYASGQVRELEAPEPPWSDEGAFSADGERVAMVDGQGVVRVWSVGTGRLLARARPLMAAREDPGYSRAVALSADGRLVAWSVGGAEVYLHEVDARRMRRPLRGHIGARVAVLGFSPDGRYLASAGLGEEQRVRVWSVEEGEEEVALSARRWPLPPSGEGPSCPSFAFIGPGARLAWLDGPSLHTLDFATHVETTLTAGAVKPHVPLGASPDGTRVMTREGHALRAWSLDTGQADPARESHAHPVRTVALSPDGTWAATADWQGSVRLWDVAWGQGLGALALELAPDCLRFSPGGRWLAAGTPSGQVHLWSVAESRVAQVLSAHEASLTALAFSPDGRELATCARESGVIRRWGLPGGERRGDLDSGSHGLTALEYSPDGHWLASGDMDGQVLLWDAAQGRRVRQLQAPDASVHALRFLPDGRHLLSSGLRAEDFPHDGPGQSVLHLWEVETGALIHQRRVGSLWLQPSADGRRLLSVPERGGGLCVEDTATGEAPRLLLAVPEVASHAFSAELTHWVTGHWDCTALVWELAPLGLTAAPR